MDLNPPWRTWFAYQLILHSRDLGIGLSYCFPTLVLECLHATQFESESYDWIIITAWGQENKTVYSASFNTSTEQDLRLWIFCMLRMSQLNGKQDSKGQSQSSFSTPHTTHTHTQYPVTLLQWFLNHTHSAIVALLLTEGCRENFLV